jgi:hypothetical protein
MMALHKRAEIPLQRFLFTKGFVLTDKEIHSLAIVFGKGDPYMLAFALIEFGETHNTYGERMVGNKDKPEEADKPGEEDNLGIIKLFP